MGLERQWRRKEAALRTFGLASLLGCMGGLLGPGYALMGLGLLGLLVIFLNVQSLLAGQGTELTTSVALLVTGFTGVFGWLSGRGSGGPFGQPPQPTHTATNWRATTVFAAPATR